MKQNTFIAVWVFFLSLSFCTPVAWAGPDTPDGPYIVDTQDPSSSETASPYLFEEFEQLSDEEKRQIYFNEPQRLPDNFQADRYHGIMHPKVPE